MPDLEYRYLVLRAAAEALERDDREHESALRASEARATLKFSRVATAAIVVQAIAMLAQVFFMAWDAWR